MEIIENLEKYVDHAVWVRYHNIVIIILMEGYKMEQQYLYTDRLLLRKFTIDDHEDLYEYLSNSKVVKYEPYDTYT